mgnify:CR=1 FL=1
MGERNKRTKLKKSMGPGSIWAVAVGSIIGWGCFYTGWSLDRTCRWTAPAVSGISGRRSFNDRGRLQLFLYDRKIPGSGW